MHQKFQTDTAKKTEDNSNYYVANKDMSKKKKDREIGSIYRQQKCKDRFNKYKILQHTKECNARNQG
ncbi:unnamed protein product [Paramecium octaurelia]|uniref:Uncharacterized protein n=1 Tax=Paramecium octaurelia TaxID=43137 RepID=A0A8S1SWZ0_PAROT|nr:unnamed protein product [Paramecium octaurelia]